MIYNNHSTGGQPPTTENKTIRDLVIVVTGSQPVRTLAMFSSFLQSSK